MQIMANNILAHEICKVMQQQHVAIQRSSFLRMKRRWGWNFFITFDKNPFKMIWNEKNRIFYWDLMYLMWFLMWFVVDFYLNFKIFLASFLTFLITCGLWCIFILCYLQHFSYFVNHVPLENFVLRSRSKITSRFRRGEGKEDLWQSKNKIFLSLENLWQGGKGVEKVVFLRDVIYERPLTSKVLNINL